VHGATVLRVTAPGGPLLSEADGLISSNRDVVLSMLGADCALVGFASPEGVLGVAHAGWRGLRAGVIAATTAAMRADGATTIVAAVGPMIGVECYPFGEEELAAVVAVLGETVRGLSSAGEPALDMRRAVDLACAQAGATIALRLGGCTACDGRFYSWRAGRDDARHALGIGRRLAAEER
jgi:copper oxidase (laccase) domain-containing protein